MSRTHRILVLNGPNLNLLGTRQPEIYGAKTLADIQAELESLASELGVEVTCRQSNHEGQLIDWIQEVDSYDGLIINGGAYTHTSIAIADAIASVNRPAIEVHISNIHARAAFRHHSHFAREVVGQVIGLGTNGYKLALRGLSDLLG
ncbi:MAG: type II 3-dehydroquinate dehydratase [Myxococcales bacterium]|nr:type II 3-dehydroquinate dehydratase [Myxococcales bacterium]